MKVETSRFGVIEIEDSTAITMVSGPLGFEKFTRFCLVEHSADSKFRWLQSIDEPGLAFAVVNPSDFFVDYEIEISDSDVRKLELACEDDAIVLSILTIREGGREVTANLAAPVIINSKNLRAAQVVIQDERYATRHSLLAQPCADEAIAKAA